MNWLFRDPLRGVLNFDKFPYERAEGELEIDFMFKSVIYIFSLGLASVMFLEGGWAVFGTWAGVNGLRRRLQK